MGVATVDAADAAGAHEADPDGAAHGKRPADGRRADRALRDAEAEVPRPGLARARVEALELLTRQPDTDLAVEDADGRGHRTRSPHALLRFRADRHAFARREAVRDQRRLERDDRMRLANFFRDADHGIAPTCATQRAAASAASSAPPRRNPAASASPAPVVSTTDTSRAWHRSTSPPRKTSNPDAPRLTTRVSPTLPSSSHSSVFPKPTSGASSSSRSRNLAGPWARIRVHADRSTLRRAPCVRASSAARAAAASIGEASS